MVSTDRWITVRSVLGRGIDGPLDFLVGSDWLHTADSAAESEVAAVGRSTLTRTVSLVDKVVCTT